MNKTKKGAIQPQIKETVNFLFEVGILSKTPRSGFYFLGSGQQSVAEHVNRVCYIGFALAHMAKVDVSKVLGMTLFHDVSETRISDLNYVHQKYTEKKEEAAVLDITSKLPFGNDIRNIIHEYEERESFEAKLAKDADNLELLLCLKEQADIGNQKALTWIPQLIQRLLTQQAKVLAETILATDSDEWWYGDKEDKWWVHRNKVAKQRISNK